MTKFDVIVVGAGGSGGPLAARLSEDPDRRVLLVEAGPAPAEQSAFPEDLLNPGLMTGYMPGHPHSWSLAANLTPDKQANIARGKVLGGSTSLNGTYYIRARKRDFDEWAARGNPEWAFEKVLPYYERLEHDLEFGDREGHGDHGPVPISRASDPERTTYSKAFIEACLAEGFPWEEDKNGEQAPGIGILPTNSRDGVRMSTGLTFVNPARDRHNFEVWGDTLARRVIFEGTRVIGLEVSRGGDIQTIDADEVVISAGAFKSPHLLALSGVGPKAELAAAGIPVVVDLKGVGKGFSDHPSVPVNWVPRERIDEDGMRFAFQTVLHYNSDDSKHDGDIELMPMMCTMMTLVGLPRGESNDLTLAVAAQSQPLGTVTTISADPAVQPRIDYNYLSDSNDLKRLREGTRMAAKLLQSAAFEPYFERFVSVTDDDLADDTKLDAWIASVLDTAIHASGSCRMGEHPEGGDVVDQYGRVHGVSGLRVADTSILPFTPSRGPSATAMLIGERVAALMNDQLVSRNVASEVRA